MKDTVLPSLEKMQKTAEDLTLQMDQIFAQFPNCEAPEFMPKDYYDSWSELWKLRKEVWDYITRIEVICGSFEQFFFANFS